MLYAWVGDKTRLRGAGTANPRGLRLALAILDQSRR